MYLARFLSICCGQRKKEETHESEYSMMWALVMSLRFAFGVSSSFSISPHRPHPEYVFKSSLPSFYSIFQEESEYHSLDVQDSSDSKLYKDQLTSPQTLKISTWRLMPTSSLQDKSHPVHDCPAFCQIDFQPLRDPSSCRSHPISPASCSSLDIRLSTVCMASPNLSLYTSRSFRMCAFLGFSRDGDARR